MGIFFLISLSVRGALSSFAKKWAASSSLMRLRKTRLAKTYSTKSWHREDGLPIFRVAPAAEQILERALRQFRQQYGGLLLVLGLGGGVLQLGDCSSQDLDALLAGQEVEVGGAEEPDIVGVDGVKPPSGWGRAAL